jgi:hypothetical protein
MVALELAAYARLAVRPRIGGAMFRYRLHSPDGDDLAARSDLRTVRFGSDAPTGWQRAGGTVAWGGGPLVDGRGHRPAHSQSAVVPKVGEEIHLAAGQRFRVLDVVPFEEEDESPFVGLLRVEAA